MKALGDRDLDHIISREDAGYIDVFASRLVHYPSSIVLGLSLVLGVWVLLAIALAFRKDFPDMAIALGTAGGPIPAGLHRVGRLPVVISTGALAGSSPD